MFVAGLQTLLFSSGLQSVLRNRLASASPEDWGYDLMLKHTMPHARCLGPKGLFTINDDVHESDQFKEILNLI